MSWTILGLIVFAVLAALVVLKLVQNKTDATSEYPYHKEGLLNFLAKWLERISKCLERFESPMLLLQGKTCHVVNGKRPSTKFQQNILIFCFAKKPMYQLYVQ